MSKQNMEIQVGSYYLIADQFNYWVEQEYMGKDAKDKSKKQRRRVSGYAWSIDNLINQFVERKHKAVEAKTMSELIKELKQIAVDTELIKKTAIKENLKTLRQIEKEAKELNEKHNAEMK